MAIAPPQVVLALVAVQAESQPEAEAYTIGQAYSGWAPGIITGVDYGYGRVAGYGAIGNRGYLGGYGGGFYGKREAEAEPKAEAEADAEADSDSEAYTFGQIAYGLPQANAYATGHPHNVGVITGVDYGHGRVSGYGAIGNRGYAGYGAGYSNYGAGYGAGYGSYGGYRGAYYG